MAIRRDGKGWPSWTAAAVLLTAALACGEPANRAKGAAKSAVDGPDAFPVPAYIPSCSLAIAEPLTAGIHPPRALAARGFHCYRIDLPPSAYLRATVTQAREFDLVWDLFDRQSRWQARFDAVAGGVEPLHWIHSQNGPALISIHELAHRPGKFSLTLEIEPFPPPNLIARSHAARTFAAADRQFVARRQTDALKVMVRAVDRLAATDDPVTEAALIYRLADLLHQREEMKTTLREISQRLVHLQDLHGTDRRRAYSRLWAARDPRNPATERWAREALHWGTDLQDPEIEAQAESLLGHLYRERGEPGAAEKHYEAATERFLLADRPVDAAALHFILGRESVQYSDVELAQASFDRAEELLSEAPQVGWTDFRSKIFTLLADGRGRLSYTQRHWTQAREHFATALALAKEHDFPDLSAAALDGLARTAARLGQDDLSERLFAQAIAALGKLGDSDLAWDIHLQRAYEDFQGGRWDEAERDYLALCPDSDASTPKIALRPLSLASCRLGLGRIARARGQWTAALKQMEEALELVETYRSRADRLDHRQNLAARRQYFYEELIDVHLHLFLAQEGDQREQAFQVSERSHARSLLDLLRQGNESQLSDLSSPQAIGASPTTEFLSLREAQELASSESALILQYDLGPHQSYLWAIRGEDVSVFRLPRRSEIEGQLKDDLKAIRDSHRPQGHAAAAQQAARRASNLLLDPVAHLLAGQPLWIIAQEELDGFPFAALPLPSGSATKLQEDSLPLAARHVIVRPPSVSSIGWLRRWAKRAQPTPGKVLAVVADPAYGPHPQFPRLPNTAREARTIAALVPEKSSLLLTGPAAEPTVILDGQLANHRYLHFATHAVGAVQHQELSSLILAPPATGREATNSPPVGHLYAHQIAQLTFAADLAVLAGCDTGRGEKLAGDSLQGLPQAFFRAGVPRVLVSLWPIEDQATAYFMERFYQALLEEQTTPAQALQLAQMSLRNHPDRLDWRASAHWASFALRGAP